MVPLAFHGGTALRFLFATARYSEDLDFCLEGKVGEYDFRSYLKAIEREFALEGYEPNIKVNDKKNVHNAFIRFPGLVYELGLSPHRRETLSVKQRWIQHLQQEQFLKRRSFADMSFGSFNITTKHPYSRVNCMRSSSAHISRGVTYMI
ncbi:MAG: hypothetical protein A2W01_08835 [Candidatus Solincola sediminis]|uniref:Nucleotidyl transferase AbiEii/AbiGii toxin family protein n=1 Tax=Candidatus Solincola sediminis TaxID=1797199 RepID=A0A1F2WR90_9ACTN|nr:MAG: hypothetical protein A2Y75_11225 [Candidatus Solincola sediminis]OFW60230.1 MAG: hypothetical protein A2W01_08835 [Candidatus Solincola sediminis]